MQMRKFTKQLLKFHQNLSRNWLTKQATYANYSEIELYLLFLVQDEHFETIASKIGAFLPN